VGLEKLKLSEFQSVEPRMTRAVYGVLGVEKSVASRASQGGTAPAQVRLAAARWRKNLAKEVR
jgi:argininosuccinate lyase